MISSVRRADCKQESAVLPSGAGKSGMGGAASNSKGGVGGRPELSLVELTRFAPYIGNFALTSPDVKKERESRRNLGVAH